VVVLLIIKSDLLMCLVDLLTKKKVTAFLDSLTNVFTICGVIAGIITIFITYRNLKAVLEQVKEMKVQRMHSQEPDLFIEPIDLSVDYRDEEIVFHAKWSDKNNGIFDENNPLPIKITNIGNGVAKYISIETYFEEDYLYELMEIDEKRIFNIRIPPKNEYGLYFFQYEYGENLKKRSMHNFDIDQKKTFSLNYLRPDQTKHFHLPEDIWRILNMSLYLRANYMDKDLIPRVKVCITYYDSFNNKYVKDIDIYVQSVNIKFSVDDGFNFAIDFVLNALNRLPSKESKE
jgi:hypothetical protein